MMGKVVESSRRRPSLILCRLWKRETLQYYSKSKNQHVGKEGDYSGAPEVPSPPGTTRRLRILDLSERTQRRGRGSRCGLFFFFSFGLAGVVQARPSQGTIDKIHGACGAHGGWKNNTAATTRRAALNQKETRTREFPLERSHGPMREPTPACRWILDFPSIFRNHGIMDRVRSLSNMPWSTTLLPLTFATGCDLQEGVVDHQPAREGNLGLHGVCPLCPARKTWFRTQPNPDETNVKGKGNFNTMRRRRPCAPVHIHYCTRLAL